MKKQSILSFILASWAFTSMAQISPTYDIDTSWASSAISRIISADLDQNGYRDIVASFSGSSGKLGYYRNQNGSFDSLHIIAQIPFLTSVSAGDFNHDGWTDLVAIGDIDFNAFLFINMNGSFSGYTVLDTHISNTVNDVEVADFDQDGSDDIVIIGQHSIDYYRNSGGTSFQKEPILTTGTSPKPLECMDLDVADFNGDGYPDLVCAETAGLVVYINSGTGVFAPQYYSIIPEIGWLVHAFDVDNDGDTDAIMRTSSGDMKWFDNKGNGVLSFESQLAITPTLHSFMSIDFNGDGARDLFASYLHHISVFLNDSNHSFSTEITFVQDSTLYMDALCLTDLNNDNNRDYVWSGYTRKLSYYLVQSANRSAFPSMDSFSLFPNPASGLFYIQSPAEVEWEVNISDMLGHVVFRDRHISGRQPIQVAHLTPGVYMVRLHSETGYYTRRLWIDK